MSSCLSTRDSLEGRSIAIYSSASILSAFAKTNITILLHFSVKGLCPEAETRVTNPFLCFETFYIPNVKNIRALCGDPSAAMAEMQTEHFIPCLQSQTFCLTAPLNDALSYWALWHSQP